MSSFLSNIVDDLRAKHLWPIALILLLALIAIPLFLSKPGKDESASVPPPASAPQKNPDANSPIANFQPIVQVAAPFPEESKEVRKFARKDPFASQASTATDQAGQAGTPSDSGTAGTGTSDTTGTTDTSTGTTGDTTGGGGVRYYEYVANVKFGKEGSKAKNLKLTALRSLPNSKNAVVVFLGIRSDGKTAVFLLSSSATTTGDGRCIPSDDECAFIYMRKGDNQVVETVDSKGDVVSYLLELRSIDIQVKKAKTSSSGKSSSSTSTGSSTSTDKDHQVTVDQRTPAKTKAKRRRVRKQLELYRVVEGIGF